MAVALFTNNEIKTITKQLGKIFAFFTFAPCDIFCFLILVSVVQQT